MGNTVIQVDNISKYYRLGVIGTGTLTHDLSRWWALLRGRPDPTIRVDQIRNVSRGTNGTDDFIWALKDISFEAKQGEVVGIIGRNGAGKSTLLKILSRVTAPTTGECRVKGRIASLLEVGTGFHPELTGRENIFLNGAILGMTKAEIRRKFDEIVAFSEVEQYIDTPVKRYSSGMYVRLAFSVAAHLEPEILIIDEVLAVGDAEFQKKCLGKVGVISGEGRTVLFVSHNMTAISNICERCFVLDKGQISYSGSAKDSIDYYIDSSAQDVLSEIPGVYDLTKRKNPYKENLIIRGLRLLNSKGIHQDTFQMGEQMSLVVDVEGMSDYRDALIGIIFKSRDDQWLASLSSGMSCSHIDYPRQKKEQAILSIPHLPFTPGSYCIAITVARKGIGRIDYINNAAVFSVTDADIYGTGYQVTAINGVFYLNASWSIVNDTTQADTGSR
jgi:lipopolysaccharide transport system ATP-binding protein